jgi:hypothetical protein
VKKAGLLVVIIGAGGLAACAADPQARPPGPAYEREHEEGRPGLFGDLRWNVDLSGNREPVSVSEERDFKRWQESNPSSEERREFEEWRAWQEWKRKNPK